MKVRRSSYVLRNVTDEAQFSVHPNLLKKHTFRADEKEISFFKKLKENISQYSEEKQKEIKNLKHPSYILAEEFKEELNSSCEISYNEDTYFFAEENILNKIIQDSIDKAVADLKLNVPLGISWVIGDNWKECH